MSHTRSDTGNNTAETHEATVRRYLRSHDESVVAASAEVTALVGPNGSGKSTLLKGLADQVTPRRPLDSE